MEKWKSGRFGIVITDCDMPEMDGYELTRSIRKLESGNGRTRIPIIACTANALAGEAEACFAAGMDDYLVKPVELMELLKKLDQWLPIPGSSAPHSATPGADAAVLLDRLALAEISGGDAAAEREILAEFRRANDADASMLEQAIARNDPSQVAQVAHRIKGASRMIGAAGLAGVCARIERASRAGDWSTVESGMQAMHLECMRLNAYIESV